MIAAPITHDIVLVGGGHTHALLLRRWAMDPLPGVRLTLISRDVLTPYSGMLPGFIAGHYTFEDVHIDLFRLCAWADVRFIKAEMTGIDLSSKTLQLSGRPDVGYDILSLDTGSTPTLSVPGAAEHATPVKPVSSFIERWRSVENRKPANLGVVGAGAGGFELVSAMAHRMKHEPINLHWFLRGDTPMSDRPGKVGERALQSADEAGINIHTGFDVKQVEEGCLHAVDGRTQEFADLLWCTAASAPAWPGSAGLDTDSRGFVAIAATLQSTSHPDVFATGDIGTQIDTPSAKAGVYAVRQAPVLFHNLRALVTNNALKAYVPQKDFLSLVSTGGRYAIGSRSGVTFSGAWVWRWKHSIDQAFMDKFIDLPKRTMSAPATDAPMRCSGCGSKIPAEVLRDVLADFPIVENDRVNVSVGVAQGDDAAVFTCRTATLVQSVDQLRAMLDDPYVFGRIAALHALSDAHAQQSIPHSAQVLLTIPFASPSVMARELRQLMLGIHSALQEDECTLVGGHSAEGEELQVGLVVNAELAEPHESVESANKETTASRGSSTDREWSIILTQPLGIGLLFAGLMQAKAQGVDVDAALSDMMQSNAKAAKICRGQGMRHCTDVTGFGLLGHLHNTAHREQLICCIQPADVPVMAGIEALIQAGVQSSLSESNQLILAQLIGAQNLSNTQKIVLTDPQTAGGLVTWVPKHNVDKCIDQLRAAGYEQSAVIGRARYINDRTDSAGVSVLG